ncbi:MAG: signal peptidase I [Nitrosopumilus sp.]|nr:MAG: signal peptidase I [Candidatus Nitrosomarinus sp.]
MAKRSISKGVIKDIAIVVIAVVVIWLSLQAVFGTQNPFYVVASGSMIPALEVYDIIVIQGHDPFEEVQVGDIIVFDRPSDHNRVIVHRVESILNEEPFTVRTQGDANPSFIRGTDYPITEEEYIGKVAYVIPQVGYITQILKPPMNYIIIAIVIGVMIIKQFAGKKKDVQDIVSKETLEELSDIGEVEADSEYSANIDKLDISEEPKQAEEKSNDDKEKSNDDKEKSNDDKENNQ